MGPRKRAEVNRSWDGVTGSGSTLTDRSEDRPFRNWRGRCQIVPRSRPVAVTADAYRSCQSQQRPWRAVDPDLFRFTTTELRDLHIGLMSAFDQAAIVAPALNLDQVRGALRTVGWEEWVDDASLQRALAALVGWGLLDATQDHGAVYSTPEEFERKNLQWSLTPRGEAGISGLLHALDSLKHAVGLQPAVLDAIGDGLGDLADLLKQPATDAIDARIHAPEECRSSVDHPELHLKIDDVDTHAHRGCCSGKERRCGRNHDPRTQYHEPVVNTSPRVAAAMSGTAGTAFSSATTANKRASSTMAGCEVMGSALSYVGVTCHSLPRRSLVNTGREVLTDSDANGLGNTRRHVAGPSRP